MTHSPAATVLSLAQLLEQQAPSPPLCLVEPGLLPAQGILFVGENLRSANRCWSPIWRCRWRLAATGWAFRYPLRAAC